MSRTSRARRVRVRFAPVLAVGLLLAQPAFAIQEVILGPRAPTLSTAPAPGFGWGMAPAAQPGATFLPGFGGSGAALAPDDAPKAGSFQFSTQSGPSWSMGGGVAGLGLSSFGASSFGPSFSRPEFGWTTRSTVSVMATDTLMFYSSVGQTSFGGSATVPTAPGLALIEGPTVRNDVRAGFKMELAPGLSFGMEAAFSQGARR